MSDADEVIDLNFAGVEPAIPGAYVTLPKGEYQMQCKGARKFFTGEFSNKPDPDKPNLEFKMEVINHPTFQGQEFSLYHSLGNNEWARKFLLNTLMCLIPEVDWQKGGMQIPLSALVQKVQGRTTNGLIEWEINQKDDKQYVNNKLKALKKYDPTVPPPVATDGNPPIINNTVEQSPVMQQASAGVSAAEVDAFVNQSWPSNGSPDPAATSVTEDALGGFNF